MPPSTLRNTIGCSLALALVALLCPSFASAPDPPLQALAPFEVVLDGLNIPRYLTVDAQDRLLLSEAEPGRVLQIAPDQTVTILLDNLVDPEGLAVDPAAALIVAAERLRGVGGRGQHGVLLRRDLQSHALSIIVNEFEQPKGLALDVSGRLILSAEGRKGDTEPKGSLYVVEASGHVSLLGDGFTQPQGVLPTVDGGALVAAEQFKRDRAALEGSVFRIDPTGQVTAAILRRLKEPFGLARDPLGALYVAGFQTGELGPEVGVILKRRPDGQELVFAKGLHRPQGLALDSHGHLYVVEAQQKRLLKFIAPAAPKLDPPPPSPTNQSTLLLRGTAEPGALLTLQVESAPATGFADASGRFSFAVGLAKNAPNALQLFATAAAGEGLTSPPIRMTVIHDDTPPIASLTAPSAGALLRGTSPVTVTAADGGGIGLLTLTADGASLGATNTPPLTTTLDTTLLTDGLHTLTAIARDKAGNEARSSITITTDNTAPAIGIVSPGNGSTVPTATPALSLAFSDTTAGVNPSSFRAFLDGNDISTAFALLPTGATATLSTPLANGPHTLQASLADRAGNLAIATARFTVSATPTLTGFAPPMGTVGTLVTLTGTNLDSTGRVTFNGSGASFTVLSATQVTATVPPAATSGPIALTTPGGTATSIAHFTALIPPSLSITSPANGASVLTGSLLVRGAVNAGGAEVGVVVNGVPAALQGTTFAALIPVTSETTSITAVARAANGTSASERVTITVTATPEGALGLHASPASGAAPLRVTFSLLAAPAPATIELDVDGNGTPDFTGPSLEGQIFTYAQPGLYFPSVTVTDASGATTVATAIVQVHDRGALDALLQAKWTGLKNALLGGDIEGAVSIFAQSSKEGYRKQFIDLASVGALGQIAMDLRPITLMRIRDMAAEYDLRAARNGIEYSFHVLFLIDTDGLWRLWAF